MSQAKVVVSKKLTKDQKKYLAKLAGIPAIGFVFTVLGGVVSHDMVLIVGGIVSIIYTAMIACNTVTYMQRENMLLGKLRSVIAERNDLLEELNERV